MIKNALAGMILGIIFALFLIWVGAQIFSSYYGDVEDDVSFFSKGDFIWPVSSNERVITSCYGERVAPCVEEKGTECIQFGSKDHPGIDIRGKEDRPVVAVVDGEIKIDSDISLSLNSVDKQIRYVHIKPKSELDGKFVRQGDEIGFIGAADEFSTAPHLHLEVYDNANKRNPLCYLEDSYEFKEGISCNQVCS